MPIRQRRIAPGRLVTSGTQEHGKEWIGYAGGTIAANDIVAMNGTNSNHVQIVQADADALNLTQNILMVALHAAVLNDPIRVVDLIVVSSVNTGGASVSDPVYLSSTAGGWTLTRPVAPAFQKQVGIVVVADATVGVIVLGPSIDYADFGAADIMLVDNLASAWAIREAGNIYQRFRTSNGSERIEFPTNPIRMSDAVAIQVGSDADLSISFAVAGAGTMQVLGLDQTATTVASSALRIDTGNTSEPAAAAGGASGAVTIESGTTDVTLAGGTGGNSGAIILGSGSTDISAAVAATGGSSGSVTIRSGAASSTGAGATSANSGTISITSGNSADADSGTITIQSGTGGDDTGTISVITGNAGGAGGNDSGSIVLTTGTAGGTRGVLDINAATVDTATQATQILAIDANAAALQIGSTGDLDMMTFSTVEAAEVIIIAAADGLRLNDNSELRFGTPGTDLVFTPDGTDVVVTATGILRLNNDVQIGLGTATNDRFTLEYDGGNRLELLGASITGGGATQATRPLLIATGTRTKNDADAGVPASGAITVRSGATAMTTAAAIGGVSGAVTIQSGASDVTFAAATGGASGNVILQSGATDISAAVAATGGASGTVTIQSGAATSVGGGTSGASGTVTIASGGSDDGATGAMTVESGVAAAAGGGIVSGTLTIRSGTVGGTGTSGSVLLSSGSPAGAGVSGALSMTSGNTTTGTTGAVSLISGNATGAGTSGNVVVTTGSTVGGTRGVFDINSATVDTATQATQLLILDASATALQIGSAGDLDMMTFNTTEGTEVVVIAAADGLRLNDNSELRFGTPGTDLVFTPDGTDVGVTATGILRFNNDVVVGFGTAANDRFTLEYDGGNRLELFGTDITAGGATQATRPIRIDTGDRVVNDAVGGTPASGAITIASGATNCTDGAGTAGATGALVFQTGAATSTAGTSGASGSITVQTGNSDDAASGAIIVQTGTAGTTRGILDLNVVTIDAITQAIFLDLIDNNAAGLTVRAGAAGATILTVVTTDAAEAFNFATQVTTTDGVASGTARRVGGRASNIVAASANITNTTVEAVFSNGTYTLPAATLKAGTEIRFFAQGIAPSTNAADTLTIAVRIGGVGGTIVSQTIAVDVANNDVFEIEGRIICRTAGTAGTIVAASKWALGAPDTATFRPDILASTAINTTIAQALVVTADWSAASTADQVRLDIYSVDVVA